MPETKDWLPISLQPLHDLAYQEVQWYLEIQCGITDMQCSLRISVANIVPTVNYEKATLVLEVTFDPAKAKLLLGTGPSTFLQEESDCITSLIKFCDSQPTLSACTAYPKANKVWVELRGELTEAKSPAPNALSLTLSNAQYRELRQPTH